MYWYPSKEMKTKLTQNSVVVGICIQRHSPLGKPPTIKWMGSVKWPSGCIVVLSLILLRFLPPNMAAPIGPVIGTHNSRGDELGYTAHRDLAQHKPIKTFNLCLPLIILYYYSDGRPTGPIKTVSATPGGRTFY